jgi:hypothetical protein
VNEQQIVVEVHGHHFYERHEGVPVLWCQGVARFHDEPDGLRIKQVPAVVLQTKDGPKLVLLQDYLRWTNISVASKTSGPEAA